jgi:uncharacterized protein (TIGR00730 family)
MKRKAKTNKAKARKPALKMPNGKYLDAKWTTHRISKEVADGLKLLGKIDEPIITFLGSHKPQPGNKWYEHAYSLAKRLGQHDYAIVTGGGPGIMEAANKGASDAHAISVGIRAALLKGEKLDHKYFNRELSYHFLFVRRFILSLRSNALIFYPGGYGTLNEFYEYVVLIQLAFIDRVPVICIGRKFWKGMFDWLKTTPKKEGFFIDNEKDFDIVQFADTEEEVLNILKKAKL